MSVFQVIAVLLTLTAFFSYSNYRFIRLPTTIGVMLIALIASLSLIALQLFDGDGRGAASRGPTDSQRVSKNPPTSPAHTVVVVLYHPARRSSSFG